MTTEPTPQAPKDKKPHQSWCAKKDIIIECQEAEVTPCGATVFVTLTGASLYDLSNICRNKEVMEHEKSAEK